MKLAFVCFLLFSINNVVFSQYPPKEIVLGSSPYTRVEDTIKRSGIFLFNDEEIEAYNSDYYINSAPMGTKAQLNDENGELVLFTDGANIYNRNGERIENGDSLSLTSMFIDGLFSLNFGADLENFTLFLDYPGESDKYFLIHTTRNYPKSFSNKSFGNIVDSVFYSVIDMSNGSGKVVEKNVEFAFKENHAYGFHASAVRHANGRDWWIILPEVFTGEFKVYLLNPNGLKFHHNEFHSAHEFQVSWSSVLNSDGSEFVTHSIFNFNQDNSLDLNIDLYNFDRCSGNFSHKQKYTTNFPSPWFIGGMDLRFSESDRFLYVCNKGQELYQFDRESGGVQWLDEPLVVGELREEDWKNRQLSPKALSNLFMSPTGELYIMFGATSDALNIVKRPERKGLNSKFELDGVLLHEHKDSFYFQSSFPHFPNMTAGPIDGSSCDTLGINNEVVAKYRNYRSTDRISEIDFYDVSYFNPTEWEWDFGDGQTSSLENPSHRYAASGTYTVCLTARNTFSEDTYCKDITIEETNSTAEFGEGKFIVYPNPAEDILYIETSGDRYNSAEIVDVSGQTVRRIRLTSGTNRTEVALDDIPQGLYFLKINDETKKFVKF